MKESKRELGIKGYLLYRFLESFPGLLSWTLILFPIVISFFNPSIAAYFILAYTIYWVYNSIKFVIYAFVGHRKLLFVIKQDWLLKLKNRYPKKWKNYYYCALIPFANESVSILRETVESIANSNFPNDRIILCLSSEKAIESGKEVSKEILKEFKGKFAHVYMTEHELKPGEIKGKSSNQNHGGRFIYNEIKKLGIKPSHVLITSNDSDMTNHPQYIPYLLYKFLSNGKKKLKRIYQPVPTDYYDHWNSSFFSRLIITLGVQWRLSLQQRDNYRCTVFSFYSMNLKTLKDIGFWDTDLIPEDERTMFNALFTFGEDFKVIPLFIPTTGRSVQGSNNWQKFKEQYKQILRWAWGASEFASSVTLAMQKKDIPMRVKIFYIFNQVRTSTEWVLTSILPLIGGMIPFLINEEFRETNLAFALPGQLQFLMLISSFMTFFILYMEHKLAPKKPEGKNFIVKIFYYLQWLLLPYVGFLLSAIPALDAQTRLIFNRRLVYVASKKE